MPRNTKIVATLGPACSDPVVLQRMLAAGVDVVRLNFSHGAGADHVATARLVRQCRRRLGREIASWPTCRARRSAWASSPPARSNSRRARRSSSTPSASWAMPTCVGLDYKELPQDVAPGAVLLLNDGLIRLNVEAVDGPRIITKVVWAETLSNNKGINRMGGGLTAGADGQGHGGHEDGSAARSRLPCRIVSEEQAGHVHGAAAAARRRGSCTADREDRAREAITFLEEIIEASDGIMVARGDLAVEVGNASVPGLQKRMIKLARERNKLTITATQMMESMIHAPVPTRAEVSDVANAVLDGTDAVMLSAETAAGRYPVETVETMAQICVEAEKSDNRRARPRFPESHLHARRPVGRDGHAVHAFHLKSSHCLADRLRLDRAVDVAAQLRLPDLRADAQSRVAAQDGALPQRASHVSSNRAPTATWCLSPRKNCSSPRA